MCNNDIRQEIKNYYDVYWGVNFIYENWAKRYGLTINSLFTLYIIHEYPDQCTLRFLCESLLFPKQTVNTILDSFERKGYLTRETAKDDKRSKIITLTTAGQQYADLLLSDLLAFEQEAFRHMSLSEREGLIKGNWAFYHNLKDALNKNEKL
ncbi:MarR family winged helix-turn-helix transcriptional regulator [Anaerocolumna xylanovorans]|uniref:DNA-binding transcriptional regulator, MarR family n=1 Tax=Anaerocolumna xylanovorans DSM 12503 TaxID=1121345 RepID=A0A1M7XW66_9FIRM|nr:MarR family transcriptional regulator [Anaerocolumna xylanovorans]SHO42999.1 DNA-binding transcriptional regulator, MarR family [Anaerocolumna xylanovorans DSM 12503]